MSADSPPADNRLVRYEIQGLFGHRDFAFDLEAEEPTLLTGANGTGKSTVLKSIDAIFTGRWQELTRLPFDSIKLTFDHGPWLRIQRSEDGLLATSTGGRKHALKIEPAWALAGPRSGSTWRANLETLDIYTKALDRLNADADVGKYIFDTNVLLSHGEPEWLTQTRSTVPVLFVTDQRLVVGSKDEDRSKTPPVQETRTAVSVAARHISRLMKNALSEYAAESQLRDRDFPQRVVAAMSRKATMSGIQVRRLLEENNKKAQDLQRVGLLPDETAPRPFKTDLTKRSDVIPVVATHARDTELKLAVLEPLREKLSLFSDFLRQHYKNKRIFLEPDEGFRIYAGDRELKPSQLSSGEQQILVLAYQILFRAAPSTLVLIDEPELSLHVSWQASLTEDLALMGEVQDLRFLLATHSPTVIAGRDDLRRSMDW